MHTETPNDQVWYETFYRDRRDADLVISPAVVERYSALRHGRLFHLERLHQLAGDVRGKRCLYVGCGMEGSTILFALRGAEVWALDLSVAGLRHQRRMAAANGIGARCHYVASSCEQLPFGARSFDMVVGLGILHHLQDDLDAAFAEIARVLKPDGVALFTEPISRSRWLQHVRDAMPIRRPWDASPQCRPLREDALGCLRRHFRVTTEFFGLLARFSRVVLRGRALETAGSLTRALVYALHAVDRVVLALPRLDVLAAVVVLRLRTLQTPAAGGPAGS